MELLAYRENIVHGITLDSQGFISCITETVYRQDKPVQYLYGLCIHTQKALQCTELRCEYYDYDEEGLCRSQMHQLNIPLQNISDFIPEKYASLLRQPIYRGDQYRFERKDGFLAGYTNENGDFYPARFQRKA